MNDDVKKALELVPFGYKADHAQLWMHLQILAEHIKGESARIAAACEEVRAEMAASYITANNYLHARVAELETVLRSCHDKKSERVGNSASTQSCGLCHDKTLHSSETIEAHSTLSKTIKPRSTSSETI